MDDNYRCLKERGPKKRKERKTVFAVSAMLMGIPKGPLVEASGNYPQASS